MINIIFKNNVMFRILATELLKQNFITLFNDKISPLKKLLVCPENVTLICCTASLKN
jgi:hypothetical protein